MPSTPTAMSASGVNVACGQAQAAPGSRNTRAPACRPAAMASGSMRVVARFISGVEQP